MRPPKGREWRPPHTELHLLQLCAQLVARPQRKRPSHQALVQLQKLLCSDSVGVQYSAWLPRGAQQLVMLISNNKSKGSLPRSVPCQGHLLTLTSSSLPSCSSTHPSPKHPAVPARYGSTRTSSEVEASPTCPLRRSNQRTKLPPSVARALPRYRSSHSATQLRGPSSGRPRMPKRRRAKLHHPSS